MEEAEVEMWAVGGGDGEGSGEEFRSRSAGCADLEEGTADGIRGSTSDSMVVDRDMSLGVYITELGNREKLRARDLSVEVTDCLQ